MREIKFRAVHKTYDGEFKQFSYWGLIDHTGIHNTKCFVGHAMIGCTEITSHEQYTGLKDKNGVEIYEGDIVHTGATNYCCKWCKERAEFAWYWGVDFKTYTYPVGDMRRDIKVIGNIHEEATK